MSGEEVKDYDALMAQYEASEKARQEAAERARAAEAERDTAIQDQRTAHTAVFQQAGAAARATLENAKRAYAEAAAGQNYTAMAEAQAAMAEATLAVHRYEEGRQHAEAQAKAPPPPQRAAGDDLDKRFTPRTAKWLRGHPEVLSDPRKGKQAQALDMLAQADGLEPDSDAYFAFIEERMGYTTKTAAKRPPVSAPVQRRPGGDNEAGGVTASNLTEEQKSFARSFGMTDERYAELLEKARKDGQVGRFARAS